MTTPNYISLDYPTEFPYLHRVKSENVTSFVSTEWAFAMGFPSSSFSGF